MRIPVMKLLQQAEPPEERDNVDAQKPAVQTQGPETPICNSSGAHKRHFYALQYFPMFKPRKQQTRHTVDGVGARVAEGHNVPFGGVLPHASLEEKLNFILADTMIVEDTTAPDLNPADVMKTLQAMLAQNPDDDAGPPQTSFRSVRSESPINEFKNTDILYYMALPCLFPFGRDLPEGSSALPDKTVRHTHKLALLNHFNRGRQPASWNRCPAHPVGFNPVSYTSYLIEPTHPPLPIILLPTESLLERL
jgi:hypothetical protein